MANWIRIYKRSEWGAKYGIGWGLRPLPATEQIVHHTETNQLSPNATFEQDAAEIRYVEYIGYQRFKEFQAGWTPPLGPGISYTWLVTPSGRVFEGHDVARESSHTLGHNRTGVGIALVGNYVSNKVTDKQIDAVARTLLQAEADGYIEKATVSGGHRDFVSTTCPGKYGYAALADIENRIVQLRGESVTPPVEDHYWANDTNYVKWVQASLKSLGYYFGEIDGSAGPATRSAITKFQLDEDLNPDGEAGPKTEAAIELALKEQEQRVIDQYIAANRISGNNRFDTASAVALYSFPPGRGVLVAVDGSADERYATAVAGGEVKYLPVRSGSDTPPAATIAAIKKYAPAWVKIIGGPTGVSNACAREVMSAAGLI